MAGGDRRPAHVKIESGRIENAVLVARRLGREIDDIAADPDIWGPGVKLPVTAHKVRAVWAKALKALTREERETARAIQDDRYDAMRRELWKVIGARHAVVSNGQVVREGAWLRVEEGFNAKGRPMRQDEDGWWWVWDENAGEPLRDHMPVVRALGELRQLEGQYEKLFGLAVPVQVEVKQETKVSYHFEGVDPGWVK